MRRLGVSLRPKNGGDSVSVSGCMAAPRNWLHKGREVHRRADNQYPEAHWSGEYRAPDVRHAFIDNI